MSVTALQGMTTSDAPGSRRDGGGAGGRRRLAVVIVNYRTGPLVVDCLRSLEGEIDPALDRVIVVDNLSPDDSAEVIAAAIAERGWGAWATVLKAGRNGGFSAGNNAGIVSVDAGLYLLLNPDTVVRPGALAGLRLFMDENPKVGICALRLEDPDGTPQGGAHAFPTPLRELQRGARLGALDRRLGPLTSPEPRDPAQGRPRRCDWVSGAAFCVRREVFEQTGLMDEGFFLYFEEVDMCRRASRDGWEVWAAPVGRIVHLEGSATGIRQPVKRRARYWFESRQRYFLKHHGVLGLIVADVMWLVGRGSLRVRTALGLGRRGEALPPWFTFDLLRNDLAVLLRPGRWRPRPVCPQPEWAA